MSTIKHFSRSALTRLVTFVDLAVSTRTTADYTCIGTAGLTNEADLIIMNMLRGRWEWPDARRVIASEVIRQKTRQLGVEKVAFQLAATQELQRLPELVGVSIQPVPVDGDKVSRFLPVAARAEAGKVYFVEGDWNGWLFEELEAFPYGRHDDGADTLSGIVHMLATTYSGQLFW